MYSTSAKSDAANKGTSFIRLLGFKADPFALQVDRSAWYLNEENQDNLELLDSLLEQTAQLVVVSGPAGIGKSVFMRQYIHRSRHKKNLVRLELDTRVDTGRLLDMIAAGLGLPAGLSVGDLADELFHKSGMQSHNSVLLIDNAQHLSSSCLQMLVNLNRSCGPLLNMVLFARPEIYTRFQPEQSALSIGNNAHLLNIRPLTRAQTAEYIEQRLRAVGVETPFSLTDVEVARIYQQSQGIPARINQAAKKVFIARQFRLRLSRLAGQDTQTGGLLNWLIHSSLVFKLVAVMLVAGVLLGGYAVYRGLSGTAVPGAGVNPHAQVERVGAEDTHRPASASAPPQAVVVKPGFDRGLYTIEFEKPALWVPPKAGLPAPAVPPVSVAELTQRGQAVARIVTGLPAAYHGLPMAVRARPQPHGFRLQDAAWIRRQDPRSYTIQLLSARKRRTLTRYAHKYGFGRGAAVYAVRVRGRRWYVLVSGVYASRAQAYRGLAKLPRAVRADRPLVRKLYYTQRDIRRGRVYVRSRKNRKL